MMEQVTWLVQSGGLQLSYQHNTPEHCTFTVCISQLEPCSCKIPTNPKCAQHDGHG